MIATTTGFSQVGKQELVVPVAKSDRRREHAAAPEFGRVVAEFTRINDPVVGLAVGKQDRTLNALRTIIRLSPREFVAARKPPSGKTGRTPGFNSGDFALKPAV